MFRTTWFMGTVLLLVSTVIAAPVRDRDRVRLRDPVCTSVTIVGTVTAIDPAAGTLTVAGTTVAVTPTTVLWKQGQAIAFADLQVGMSVAACGTMQEGVLIARHITVRYGGN